MLAAARPDRIVHLAGASSVGRSFAEPLATWEVNLGGTLGLLEALRTHDPSVPALIVTSGEIHGRVPVDELPVSVDTPLHPLSPYGASKAAADLAAGQYREAYGLRTIRVRAFNHVGPGQDARFVLPNVARQIARAERRGTRGDRGARGQRRHAPRLHRRARHGARLLAAARPRRSGRGLHGLQRPLAAGAPARWRGWRASRGSP